MLKFVCCDANAVKVALFSCSGTPPVWHTHGEWNYFVDDFPTIYWNDARKLCQEKGGDLAVIKSFDENKFIWDLTLTQNRGTDYGAWIGLYRKQESQFHWVDHDLLLPRDYSEWSQGNPDNKDDLEDCTLINLADGKWNDVPCDARGPASKAPVTVCQRPIRSRFS